MLVNIKHQEGRTHLQIASLIPSYSSPASQGNEPPREVTNTQIELTFGKFAFAYLAAFQAMQCHTADAI